MTTFLQVSFPVFSWSLEPAVSSSQTHQCYSSCPCLPQAWGNWPGGRICYRGNCHLASEGKPAPSCPHPTPQQMGPTECAGSPVPGRTGTHWLPGTHYVRTGALRGNLSLKTQVHTRFNFVFRESSTLLNHCCCSVAESCLTPWTAALQASLSFTISLSLLKHMSIELMMPSNHLILCPLLLLPSIFPSIRVFSSELALCIMWPNLLNWGELNSSSS